MNEAPSPPPLMLSPVALPNAPLAQTLRLVGLGNAPVLLASSTNSETQPFRTEIWAFPLNGKGASGSVATIPQLLPALPQWDAAPREDHSLTFVIELAGGAMNSLFQTDGTPNQRTPLTAHRPFGSFSGPRFVRDMSSSSGATISAVVDNDNGLVLQGPLEHPIGTCLDLVVVAGTATPTAVCKRTTAGAARGNTLPGTLHVLTLDATYRPTGAEFTPFGDRRIFEFDADSENGEIVIAATTGSQLLAAHRAKTEDKFRILKVDPGGADPLTFSAPCVNLVGHTLTVAVLSKARTPGATVLSATWPLDTPP